MASTSGILPSNDVVIVQQDTSSGIMPFAGAQMGIVRNAIYGTSYAAGMIIMYISAGTYPFKQSTNTFSAVPIKNILLVYSVLLS